MWGYHNNDEANSESFVDGWFRTGDQSFINSDGYLTLTGRLKELINRGGEKISPLEVDAALLSHPAVAEAVTFAAQDAKYGECVHAAVVLSADADSESLRAHCANTLADFKVPDTIHIADNLPRTATGKIQRRHVAAAFTGIGRIKQDKEGVNTSLSCISLLVPEFPARLCYGPLAAEIIGICYGVRSFRVC